MGGLSGLPRSSARPSCRTGIWRPGNSGQDTQGLKGVGRMAGRQGRRARGEAGASGANPQEPVERPKTAVQGRAKALEAPRRPQAMTFTHQQAFRRFHRHRLYLPETTGSYHVLRAAGRLYSAGRSLCRAPSSQPRPQGQGEPRQKVKAMTREHFEFSRRFSTLAFATPGRSAGLHAAQSTIGDVYHGLLGGCWCVFAITT